MNIALHVHRSWAQRICCSFGERWRGLALLLALPGAIEAADFTYTNNNGAIMITGYTGPGGNVTIPGTIEGLPVTSIGESAFSGLGAVTGVLLPGSVTNIGDSAFQLSGLTNFAIPDSVTHLGSAAFFACTNLASLNIGSGLTTIEGGGEGGLFGTFEGTALTRLTIPDTITNISDGPLHLGGALGAFYGCLQLTNVMIGRGLGYLGVGAFSYCTSLQSIYFEGNAPTPGQNYFGLDIFHEDALATIYYLPGATGWDSTYAGVPTALWNPQAQASDESFGVRQSRFGFNIIGTAGIPIAIETSTNLTAPAWQVLQTCTLTNGSVYFSDPHWTDYPGRFYRIASP